MIKSVSHCKMFGDKDSINVVIEHGICASVCSHKKVHYDLFASL